MFGDLLRFPGQCLGWEGPGEEAGGGVLWEGLRVLTSLQRKQLHLIKGLIEVPDTSLWPAWHLYSTCRTHSSSPGAAGLLEAQETWGGCQAWRGALPFSVTLVLRMGSRGSSQVGVWGAWGVWGGYLWDGTGHVPMWRVPRNAHLGRVF